LVSLTGVVVSVVPRRGRGGYGPDWDTFYGLSLEIIG
jgi:hypothetical protein